MKNIFIYLISITFFLAACNRTGTEQAKHAHDESAHTHDGHNHDGHDHDGHTHDGNCSEEHGHEQETHAGEITFSKAQAVAARLEAQTVAPGTFSQVIKTSGQLLSAQGDEITIVAASNGVASFAQAAMSEGAAVKEGQVLVSISAKNMVDGDPAIKAKIEYEAARKEYERAESLVKENIISKKDFEQAQLRYESANTAYNASLKMVTSKGMNVAAPASGVIKRRWVNEGEYVTVGQPIVSLSKNKRLQLRADMPAKYFKELSQITGANFKVPYDDATYKLSDLNGRLLSVGASIEQSLPCLPVTFECNNTGALIPGSFAEIYLLTATQHGVISVPPTAITEEQGLHFVYLQLDEETYKRQEVTLGANDGKRVQIISGLAQGDKVVSQGVMQVKLAANSAIIPEGHTH
jgi:RND family efflux transporter MFP subunit